MPTQISTLPLEQPCQRQQSSYTPTTTFDFGVAMKNRLLACLFIAAGLNVPALAHPGHGDEQPARKVFPEAAVRELVTAELHALVGAQKIDGSWKAVPLKKLETVQRNGGPQWLATFEHPTAKRDREMFLFISIYGDVLAGGFALDEAAARAVAQQEIERLVVDAKKLPASWHPLPKAAVEVEKRVIAGDRWEWVVICNNPAEPKNTRLFVFLKPWGDFVAANFTGK
jgi:Family of unknown function (DUF6488)